MANYYRSDHYRTVRQVDAKKIDMVIYRQISIAETSAEAWDSQNWRNLVAALRAARVHARLEMHPDDRERT